MKKSIHGFTLIELLAVIIILSIVGLITVPMILGVINKAKSSAFESSIKGIQNSIELDIFNNDSTIINYTVVDGVITNADTNNVISTKGGNDINGNIKVKKDGTIIYALNNGKECIIKRDGQENIEHIKNIDFCTMDVATNLVVNGYGEYEDNTNFSFFMYGDGAFVKSGDSRYQNTNDQYIKIDTSKKYYSSMEMKNNGTSATYYIGTNAYDYDKKWIISRYTNIFDDTLTYLTEDLNNGDTVIYLNNLSNFNISSSYPSYQLGLIFWNYENSRSYLYPENTYSRNSYLDLYLYDAINKTNNTITLKTAWNKGTIKSGTKVSRTKSESGNNYSLKEGNTLTTNYVTYKRDVITGEGQIIGPLYNSFAYGTEYVKILFYSNFNSTPNTTTYYKNIVFREID